jgi:predicted MPP superfamily phosphohydrolase
LKREGITLLHNHGVPISAGGGTLYLAGVDDVWAGRPDPKRALEGNGRGHPTLLLAHEPDYADKVSADPRIKLQLSGHTHGGQVRIPMIGALRLPSWGRKYQEGLYRVKDMHVYTTRGIGLVGVPFRVNCPPEITLLTLTTG